MKKDLQNVSDEKLIELVRTQNHELYAEVVERYQEKLLRYADYLLGHNQEAEDVVQTAFVKVYKNLFAFNIKKKFSSWIYRIVHNEAVNRIKKKRKEFLFESNGDFANLLTSKKDVELEFEKKELSQMVKKCLKQLPIKYREPLTLFFLEEKSYQEISDILRIPKGTVGTRINRGKKLMAVICRKKGGEEYVKN